MEGLFYMLPRTFFSLCIHPHPSERLITVKFEYNERRKKNIIGKTQELCFETTKYPSLGLKENMAALALRGSR